MGSEYIPLVEEDMSKARVVLPFAKLAWFTVSLPFLAFTFCVMWSITYNFEHSTSTHCKVCYLFSGSSRCFHNLIFMMINHIMSVSVPVYVYVYVYVRA